MNVTQEKTFATNVDKIKNEEYHLNLLTVFVINIENLKKGEKMVVVIHVSIIS